MIEPITAIHFAGRALVALSEPKQIVEFQVLENFSVLRVQEKSGLQAVRALFAFELEPFIVILDSQKLALAANFGIHHFCTQPEEAALKAAYATRGYECTSKHYLMAQEFSAPPLLEKRHAVWRAETLEQVRQISSLAQLELQSENQLGLEQCVRLYAVTALGQVVAWMRMVTLENMAWFDDVFTILEFRGQGIGSSVLNFASHEAVLSGAQHIVFFANEENLEFYTKKGYQVVASKLRFARRMGMFKRGLRSLRQVARQFALGKKKNRV
jgi:GNAT superfamily N-acetyltransferase